MNEKAGRMLTRDREENEVSCGSHFDVSAFPRTATLTFIAIVLSLASCRGGSSTGSGTPDTPPDTHGNIPTLTNGQERDIAGFLAEPSIPGDVKDRFIAALDDGSLAPRHFAVVSGSWRRCTLSCMGRVKSATDSSLTLEAMVDGREWTIGLSPATSIQRGGMRIAGSDLRKGEVVDVLSQDGATAQLVLVFSN
jgi:hypothetical protein